MFSFPDRTDGVAVSMAAVHLVGILQWLCVRGLLTGTTFTQMFRLSRRLFLSVWLCRGCHCFWHTASLFMLFTLFLALFVPFVVLPCFGLRVTNVLMLTAFLGAPFSAPPFSFPVSAQASGIFSLFTASFSFFASAVSFFTSIPVSIFTLSPQPVRLSVSAFTPAPIPIGPPVAVSGSRWSVLSERVRLCLFLTPASPPVAISSAVRSLRTRWASAAAPLPAVAIALWRPPFSMAASHTAVWGHVQVSVGVPEFFPGIAKYMQEIAVLPFRALLSVKQTWEEHKIFAQWWMLKHVHWRKPK